MIAMKNCVHPLGATLSLPLHTSNFGAFSGLYRKLIDYLSSTSVCTTTA